MSIDLVNCLGHAEFIMEWHMRYGFIGNMKVWEGTLTVSVILGYSLLGPLYLGY